jgi:hypothetical protein
MSTLELVWLNSESLTAWFRNEYMAAPMAQEGVLPLSAQRGPSFGVVLKGVNDPGDRSTHPRKIPHHGHCTGADHIRRNRQQDEGTKNHQQRFEIALLFLSHELKLYLPRLTASEGGPTFLAYLDTTLRQSQLT